MIKKKNLFMVAFACLIVLMGFLVCRPSKIAVYAAESLNQKRQRLTSTDKWIKNYREDGYSSGITKGGGNLPPFYFNVNENDPIINIIPEEEFIYEGTELRHYFGEKYGYIIETFKINNIYHSVVQVVEMPREWNDNTYYYEFGLKPLFEYEYAYIPTGNSNVSIRETSYFEKDYVWNDNRVTYEFKNNTSSAIIIALPILFDYFASNSVMFYGSNKFYIQDISYAWEITNTQTANVVHGDEYYSSEADDGAFLIDKDLYFAFHDLVISKNEDMFISGIKIIASIATFGLSGLIEDIMGLGLLAWDIVDYINPTKYTSPECVTTSNRSQFKVSYAADRGEHISKYDGYIKLDSVSYGGENNRPLVVTNFDAYKEKGCNDVSAAFKIAYSSFKEAFSLTTFFQFNVYKRGSDQSLLNVYKLKEEKLGNDNYAKEIAQIEELTKVYNYHYNTSRFSFIAPETGYYNIDLVNPAHIDWYSNFSGIQKYLTKGQAYTFELEYTYDDATVSELLIKKSDFAFTLLSNKNSYSVSGIFNTSQIIIPSHFMGLQVTEISSNAFKNYNNLTSITIPSTVTSIGEMAFCDCTSLNEVIFEDGSQLQSIGNLAFEYTDIKNILLPKSLTSIGYAAFRQCTSLESVTFENGSMLQTIDDSAFSLCESLRNVVIPASVTNIGSSAFSGCGNAVNSLYLPNVIRIEQTAFYGNASLTSVFVGNKATWIDNSAFYYCANIESFIVDAGNTVYKSDIEGKYLMDKSAKTLIRATKYAKEIPSDITKIESCAFAYNSSLTSIFIPASVTTINDSAFAYCTSLINVTFEHGTQLKSFAYALFKGARLW